MINTYGMSELGYTILLDRYGQKDPQKKQNLKVGDIVIAIVDNESSDMKQRREVAEVIKINGDKITVYLMNEQSEITLNINLIDRPLETNPQDLQARVAKGIAAVENEDIRSYWASQFEWLLEDWKFVPGGRILTTSGTDQDLSLFNCFVIPSPKDSRSGIMKTLTDMAELMARGGGVGINVSSLRPKNAYVKGVNGRSSGSVSWGALYSFVTGLIEQGGSRRGALMLILNDWHPDILKFISSKTQSGKITNANISVGISDAFMAAVKDNKDWTLRFPDTSFEKYDDEWNGNLEQWEAKGYPVINYKTVKAKEIWDTIVKSAWASAEPGLWFRDRANKTSNSYYLTNGEIICTNPCITGDTLVYTNKGLVKAEKLFDEETDIKVAIDGRFGKSMEAASRVFSTGIKQVYRLQTKEGYSVRATANHQIMTPKGWVELKNLQEGDLIHIHNQEGGFGDKGSLELGRIIGWYTGDGTNNRNASVLSFWDNDRELSEMFSEYVNDLTDGTQLSNRSYTTNVQTIEKRREQRVSSVRLKRILDQYSIPENKLLVPEIVYEGTREMQKGYLQSLFSADGTVSKNIEKGITVRLASNNIPLLEGVQKVLINFGIASKIYKNRRTTNQALLPDGKGGHKLYNQKQLNELVISKENVITWKEEIGFLQSTKNDKLNVVTENRKRGFYKEPFVAKIESIIEEGFERVYDLTQPTTHSFIANGIVVHNCAEQGLPANACCNLGAINLSQFWDKESKSVDWNKLIKTTRIAVRFLDNVIDASHYHIKEIENQQKGERRIGLGIMGLAELLIKAEVKYGSKEGNRFTSSVMKKIRDIAYDESCRIAEEKGAFPYFNEEGYFKSLYSQALEETTKQKIRENGIRNVTLLTVAPTGTTGTMIDTSTGIEPYFSWKFFRKGRLGIFEQNVPIAQQWLDENKGQNLPEYFVTAMDLTPEEHVLAQAEVQMWVDSSISKTVNCPNDWTVEQVSNLYMLMYNTGCKGGTIYRDGSRDEQVLNLTLDQAKDGNKKEEIKTDKTIEKQLDTKNNLTSINLPKDNVELKHLPIQRTKRPSALGGKTLRGNTPYGTVFITINEDPTGYPYEVFINIGKSGSDLQAQGETLGRMYSVAMQMLPVANRLAALKELTEQIKGIGGARSIGFGPNRVSSFSDAIATIITNEYLTPKQDNNYMWTYSAKDIEEGFQSWVESGYTTIPSNGANQVLKNEVKEVAVPNNDTIALASVQGGNTCPECQNLTLVKIEGCTKCVFCGYAEC